MSICTTTPLPPSCQHGGTLGFDETRQAQPYTVVLRQVLSAPEGPEPLSAPSRPDHELRQAGPPVAGARAGVNYIGSFFSVQKIGVCPYNRLQLSRLRFHQTPPSGTPCTNVSGVRYSPNQGDANIHRILGYTNHTKSTKEPQGCSSQTGNRIDGVLLVGLIIAEELLASEFW